MLQKTASNHIWFDAVVSKQSFLTVCASRDGQGDLHHIMERGLALLRRGDRAGFEQVGDRADAQRLLVRARRIGVQRRGLHLHRERAQLAPLERAGNAIPLAITDTRLPSK